MLKIRKSQDKLSLCKGRGFILPAARYTEAWPTPDGPLGGAEEQHQKAWCSCFARAATGLTLLANGRFVASGHVSTFNDLIDCARKMRHRAECLQDYNKSNGITDVKIEAMNNDELMAYIREQKIACPGCGKSDFTDIRKFNLMFKTHQGVTEDSSTEVYLRPETAQGIFVNFKNIQRTTRKKVPFGVCQIGKSFRNEITPGNFIFRTREFEQMELEFFCKPGTDLEWFDYWRKFCRDWLLSLNLKEESLRLRDHEKEELSHYSKATTDFEFLFPFGWGELWGIADRTDFDLKSHQEVSGESMEYFDPETGEKYIPYVVEPSLGADRVLLAFLVDAYDEEVVDAEKNDMRTVLRLHPALAPFKCAVLPLSKKLAEPAMEIYAQLGKHFMVDYDDSGSIGKRYRRQDEIGTPYCITYDFESLEGLITVRDRIPWSRACKDSDLAGYIAKSGVLNVIETLAQRSPSGWNY